MTDEELIEAMMGAFYGGESNDAREMMRAALSVVREAEGWRPIETAPKAGSEWHPGVGPVVLLGSTSGHRVLGYWDGGRGTWINLNDHAPLLYWSSMTHWAPALDFPTPPEDAA